MRHIKGNSTDEKILSIDGLLEGMKRKQLLMHNTLHTKSKEPFSFNVSGYARECVQGEIVCAYFSLMDANIKKAVIVIDSFPKDTYLFADIKLISETGKENNVRVPIKEGINSIEELQRIKPGQ